MAVSTLALVVNLVMLKFVISEAPGDTDVYCKEISSIPDYAETVKPLMDSFGYLSLLGEDGVWTAVDNDTDGHTWLPVAGEPCQEKAKVKEPKNVPQNNWIITQYISKSISEEDNIYPTNIYVNITYLFDSDCAAVPCHPSFHLKYLFANDSINGIESMLNDFVLLGNLSSTVTNTLQMATQSFVIETQNQGFYLALHDSGANVTVSRLFAYRLIGPAIQVNLTLYPETPAPTSGNVNVPGVCVANSNTSIRQDPILSLNPDGIWTLADECFCIEGHEPTLIEGIKQCQACSPGHYKYVLSNTNCLSCPDNSGSSAHGVSICNCKNGFYRAQGETADDTCTEPPSAPREVTSDDVKGTAQNVTWKAPISDGGRDDLFYNVTAYGSENTVSNDQPITDTSYLLEGLIPLSLYLVVVTAENGVSDQDGNIDQRSVSRTVFTAEAVAARVENVKVLYDMFVEWPLLTDDRGEITMYEIKFYSNKSDGDIIELDDETSVYEPNVTDDFPMTGQPVYVIVRGFTSVGAGEWSEPKVFAEVNPLAPSMATLTPSMSSSSSNITTPVITSSTNPVITSSFTSPVIASSSTSTSKNTTASTTPSPSNEGVSPLISIFAVLGGVIIILVLVTLGSVGFYVFRRIRLSRNKEDTDYTPLVKYDKHGGDTTDEDEGGRVKVDPPENID